MLWYLGFSERETLNGRIEEAVGYFRDKYRKEVNCCYIHPDMIEDDLGISGIEIIEDDSIGLNCVWIGSKENE